MFVILCALLSASFSNYCYCDMLADRPLLVLCVVAFVLEALPVGVASECGGGGLGAGGAESSLAQHFSGSLNFEISSGTLEFFENNAR